MRGSCVGGPWPPIIPSTRRNSFEGTASLHPEAAAGARNKRVSGPRSPDIPSTGSNSFGRKGIARRKPGRLVAGSGVRGLFSSRSDSVGHKRAASNAKTVRVLSRQRRPGRWAVRFDVHLRPGATATYARAAAACRHHRA